MSQPWDQLDGEGNAAYKAFRDGYLTQGMERTLAAASILLDREPRIIHRLAVDFDWIKRAREYDRWLIRTEEAAVVRSTEKHAVEWAKRRSQFREMEWTMAGDLIDLANKLIHHFKMMPLTEEIIESDTLSEDGVQRHTVIKIMPSKASLKDLPAIAKAASELARLSAGMETERKLIGIDIIGSESERLQKARDTFDSLKDQYRNRPDVIPLLPQWVSEAWGVDPKLLTEGDNPPPQDNEDVEPATDSEN